MNDTNPIRLFVTATGTDCGKTLISAILCQALQADYWKPIQTGPPPKDADTIKRLVSYPVTVHSETHYLKEPLSPHAAAASEGIRLSLNDFQLPYTPRALVVEGAGGILVPFNNQGEYVIDLASRFSLQVILVVKLYLGCINHALLSINELKSRKLTIKGLIFNGEDTFGAISLISQVSGLPTLLIIQEEAEVLPETVLRYSHKLHIE